MCDMHNFEKNILRKTILLKKKYYDILKRSYLLLHLDYVQNSFIYYCNNKYMSKNIFKFSNYNCQVG